MSKFDKVVDKAKDVALKVKDEVDLDTVEDNIGVVIDTIEYINKTNTSSKADNIQRGVQDARKVLGFLSVVRSVLKAFKRK